MEEKITVHIADDHQILIDGVKAVLNLEPKIEVTGFSLNGNEVVEWFKENQADVLVLDINMPELDGIQVLKHLKGEKNKPEIIVLSSYDDVKLVKEVLQMGAKGFVPKKSAGEHIVNAVYKVAEGNQYFTDDIKEKMMQTLLNGQVKNEGSQDGVLGRTAEPRGSRGPPTGRAWCIADVPTVRRKNSPPRSRPGCPVHWGSAARSHQ